MMLWTIIMLAFGLFAVFGFILVITYFGVGIKQVVSAKRRGEPLRPAIPPSAQKWAAKQAGRRQPIINVTVQMPSPPAEETPEQKAARERREERKRYLESLVDR
jgi:hypothetical protein